MTNLKRAGPPRAGPFGPLTKKTPVAAGVLWETTYLSSGENHTPRSDGSEQVRMICGLSPAEGGDRL